MWKTPRSALGLQDRQMCPNWQNLILAGIRNESDHPIRHQHADSPSGRGDPRPECLTPPDTGSPRGKMTAGPNPHCYLSTTNLGRAPKEGEVLGIQSWRLGPEARDSKHATEGPRKAGIQLGGPLHHCRSKRQGVIHLDQSRWD